MPANPSAGIGAILGSNYQKKLATERSRAMTPRTAIVADSASGNMGAGSNKSTSNRVQQFMNLVDDRYARMNPMYSRSGTVFQSGRTPAGYSTISISSSPNMR
jgi:hypothetical protein